MERYRAQDLTFRLSGNPDQALVTADIFAIAAELSTRITRHALSFQGGPGGKLTLAMVWTQDPESADRLAVGLSDLPYVRDVTRSSPVEVDSGASYVSHVARSEHVQVPPQAG